MRIDLNRTQSGEIVHDAKSQKVGSRSGVHPNPSQVPEDKASLSGDPVNLPALEAKVLVEPEVRHDRVEALRHSIQNGEYKVDPQAVAKAIIEHQKR